MKNYNGVMSEVIFAPVHPELKRLVGERADAADLPLNEYVARVLAEHLARPDLAWIPRKKPGGPRKPRKSSKVSA
jgi:hypothetical protein